MSDRRYFAIALTAAAACTSPRPQRAEPVAPRPAPVAALNLSEVIERTHFAFRANGDAFEAKHTTHRASMDASGRVQISPAGAQASLSLKLEGVQRGAQRWPLRTPERREVDGTGALVAHWPHGVDERWVNEARGLEQKLVLQRPPAGKGDVVVHLSARGLDYAGREPGGHRFRDARSGAGFVYGDAFALVSGRQRALEVRRVGDGLDLVVPEALAREASWPLVIDPLVSVDPPIAIAPPGPQTLPKVVWAAGNYVAAWVDGRDVPKQVWFVRIDDSFASVPFGVPLTNASVDVTQVSLACDTLGNCLFAWTDANAKFTYVPKGTTPAPTPGLQVQSGNTPTSSPAVTVSPDGTFFIAYVAGTVGQIAGAWLNPGMTSTPIPLPPVHSASAAQSAPVVASGHNGQVLVAWQEATLPVTVGYAYVSSTTATYVGAVQNAHAPALAWSGAAYHLVWQSTGAMAEAIFGAEVPAMGAGVISVPLPIANDLSIDNTSPAVAIAFLTTGAKSVQLTWTHAGRIQTASWPDSMSADSGNEVAPVNPQDHSTVACSSVTHRCLAAWEEAPGNGGDIRGALIASVSGLADSLVSVAANNEWRPAIAASRTQLFVAWSDSRGEQGLDLWGTRVSAAGGPLGALQMTTGPGDDDHLDVASDGTGFGVVFTNQTQLATTVLATVVDATGQVSFTPVTLSRSGFAADWGSVAYNGNSYVAVWQEGTMTSTIMAGAFGATGGVTPVTPVQLASALSPQAHPAIASNPAGTSLVAWVDPSAPNGAIRLIRVDAMLGLMDSAPFSVPGSTVAAQSFPSIATDGVDFLVAWVDPSTIARLAHVTAGGLVREAGGGTAVAAGQASVKVAFDGTRFVLLARVTGSTEDAPLRTMQLSSMGTAMLVTPLVDGATGDLAFLDGGAVVTLQRFEPSLRVRRVMLLPVGPGVAMGDAGSATSDGGTRLDGGTTAGDAGFQIVCEANPYGAVGVPYFYNQQGRVLLDDPSVRATFAACPNDAGFEVDALTGAVSWVPPAAQKYQLCVKAASAEGRVPDCSFTVDVSAPAFPPADAGVSLSPSMVHVGEPVTVTAVSATPSDLLSGYRWDFGDMSPLAFGVTPPPHSYDLPGSYQLELTVLDRYGRAARAKAPVQVLDSHGAVPPLARIEVAPQADGRTFTLSCPGCDAALALYWETADETVSGATVTRTFAPGRKRVRLRAVDGATGLVGNDQVMIRVDDPSAGTPPDCHAWVDPRGAAAPKTFDFSVDGLFDTSGGIHSAAYKFSDGTTTMLTDQPMRRLDAPGAISGVLSVEAVNGLLCIDTARAVALGASSSDAPPRFEPLSDRTVACGSAFDLKPVVEGTRPLKFSGTVPSAVTLDPMTGELTGTVPVAAAGRFELELHVENSAGSDDLTLSASVTCPHRGLDFETRACGCGAAGGSPLLVLGLVRLLRRRRQQPQQRTGPREKQAAGRKRR